MRHDTNRRADRWRLGAALALAVAGGACADATLILPEDAEPAEVTTVAGDGQEGRAGEWLDSPLVVEVLNAGGVPLAQVPVVFEFAAGSEGQLDPSATRTNDNGRAAVRVRLGSGTGTQVIVATVEEPALLATFRLTAVSAGDDDEDEDEDEDGGDGGGGGDRGSDGAHPDPLPVPKGHLPPPGACRIWFPGAAPGQQPAPISCAGATSQAPARTWVLERPSARPDEVRLHVIHDDRAGVVVGRYVYDAETGEYLRDG